MQGPSLPFAHYLHSDFLTSAERLASRSQDEHIVAIRVDLAQSNRKMSRHRIKDCLERNHRHHSKPTVHWPLPVCDEGATLKRHWAMEQRNTHRMRQLIMSENTYLGSDEVIVAEPNGR